MRADTLSFDLVGGKQIDPDPNWGLVWDPSGTELDKTDLFLCRYEVTPTTKATIRTGTRSVLRDYFGGDDVLVGCKIKVPCAPWVLLGNLQSIYYVRQGERSGPWHHPFSDSSPVPLYKGRGGMLLRLPPGAILDDRGFVWP